MELSNYWPEDEISANNLTAVLSDGNSGVTYDSAAVIDFFINEEDAINEIIVKVANSLHGM
jgi:hypothetical protein